MPLTRFLPQSLTARIFALYSVTLLFFVSVGLGLSLKYEYDSDIEDAQESATMLVELAAQTITESAVIGDYDTIKRTLDKSILRSQFDAAVFIDLKGTVLRSTNTARVERPGPQWLRESIASQLFDINRNITAGGVDYGVLRLTFAPDRVASSVWHFIKLAAGIALASLIGGLLLIWFPLRRWLGKLDRAQAIERNVEGNAMGQELLRLDDLPLEFRGPFEVLQRTTDSLRRELESRKQALASLRSAVSGLQPDSKTATADGDDIAALSVTLAELVAAREAGRKQVSDNNVQLNAIFALSPDGFVLFDGLQRVRFVNTAFLRMTSSIAEEWLGLDSAGFSARLANLCHPSGRFPGIDALRTGHSSRKDPNPLGEEDDVQRHCLCELSAPANRVLEFRLRLAGGEDVSQVLYCRDITHETEIDRMKSEFLSHAAHELRTPMSSILGYSEVILAMEFSEEDRRELLQTIHRQSALLVSIINELLDLARIEERRGKDFVIEKCELHELIGAVVAGWAPPPGRPPPSIAGSSEQIWLRGDRTKLMQALGNILSNAYKYSPAGGKVDLLLGNDRSNGIEYVTISVKDHGIGMSEDQLKRVCERFYRADTSGKIPGTGLGMAIVKEIVELHGGDLRLDSTPGAGTTVTIRLPSFVDAPQPAALH